MKKDFLIFLLIALIIFGIFFRIASLNNEFIAEETEFIKAGIAIANTGHPVFYQSEQEQTKLALWHPPMYIYSLAFLFKIFPITEITARSLNIVFSLLTAILIFLFCFKIIGKKPGALIGLIASAFFLINFYVLSSSILIDIDALSTFFVFGFVYFTLRHYQTKTNLHLILSGIFLFFGIYNRYPMMFLTYIFIGAYYLYKKDLREYFPKYLLNGITVAILFLGTWTIYSTIFEPGNFFSFLSHNANLGAEQFSNLAVYIPSFFLNIAQFIRLFTFPATILGIWAIFHLFNKKTKLIKILLLYILPIFILFLLMPRPAFGYPRYFMTILPGIIILISIFIYKNLEKETIEEKEFIIVFLSSIISFFILLLLSPQPAIYSSKGLIFSTNLPDFAFNLLASLPILLVFFLKEKRKMLILILIALTLVYCFYFNFQLINNEPKIIETATYIKQHTEINDSVICPYAIGYYLDRPFYNNDHNLPELNFSPKYLAEYFKTSYTNPKMDNPIFWPDGLYSGLYSPIPPEQELQKAKYIVKYYPIDDKEPEKIIGDFYIYRI